MGHYVSEGAPFQELHDDPQLITDEEAVVHVDDVRVVIVAHDHHLQNKEGPHACYNCEWIAWPSWSFWRHKFSIVSDPSKFQMQSDQVGGGGGTKHQKFASVALNLKILRYRGHSALKSEAKAAEQYTAAPPSVKTLEDVE